MTNMKKYAPVTMREIVTEDEEIKQRLEDYADGLRTGHVLMHGPKGTGKSSAANVIAQQRTGGDLGAFTQAYEGAKFTESHLDKILNDWDWQRSQGVDVPVAVINEVDLLSAPLMEKLKAFTDECGHLGQIVATTNNPHKLSAAQQDRFDVIEMPAISPETFAPRVREILEAEQVEISDDDLRDVLATTNGSWRDALSAAEDIIVASKRKPKP
jgi:DNA polymerase III delta prime subunit